MISKNVAGHTIAISVSAIEPMLRSVSASCLENIAPATNPPLNGRLAHIVLVKAPDLSNQIEDGVTFCCPLALVASCDRNDAAVDICARLDRLTQIEPN